MDSLTQLTLGAAVGYVVAGRKLGKKALLWGAFAGTLPDLDFIPTLPLDDEFLFLKYHRGFSHSFIFTVVGAAFMSWVLRRKELFSLFFWGFLTHIILDAFTSWGTQLFWPLSPRIAFNAIFIVDPFYSIPLIIAVVASLFYSSHEKRKTWILVSLVISSMYLVMSLGIKLSMNHKFETLFKTQGLDVIQYKTRPSPFNIILWSATAETEDHYHYAMISLFDSTLPHEVYTIEKKQHHIESYTDERTQELLRYTKGYFSTRPYKDGVLVHDLRYGFMGDPFLNGENYVFSYYLQKTDDGTVTLRVYNPRPTNTSVLLAQLWERLKGI